MHIFKINSAKSSNILANSLEDFQRKRGPRVFTSLINLCTKQINNYSFLKQSFSKLKCKQLVSCQTLLWSIQSHWLWTPLLVYFIRSWAWSIPLLHLHLWENSYSCSMDKLLKHFLVAGHGFVCRSQVEHYYIIW